MNRMKQWYLDDGEMVAILVVFGLDSVFWRLRCRVGTLIVGTLVGTLGMGRACNVLTVNG